jgi:probable HAF family extracellular repeat protein
MKLKTMRVLAPALFTAIAALPAAAQSYNVTNLGLGGAPGSVTVAGVNANGQVSGTSYTSGGNARHAYFATQADGTIDIGTLGSNVSSAIAINASGQVIGDSRMFDNTGFEVTHAFSWTKDGGIVDVGTLGGVV